MAGTVDFELVSPERLVISAPVEMVVVPGAEGDFGVLPGHAPFISTVRTGVISIWSGGAVTQRIFVAGGFAEVNPERCTVLAEEAVGLEKRRPAGGRGPDGRGARRPRIRRGRNRTRGGARADRRRPRRCARPSAPAAPERALRPLFRVVASWINPVDAGSPNQHTPTLALCAGSSLAASARRGPAAGCPRVTLPSRLHVRAVSLGC